MPQENIVARHYAKGLADYANEAGALLEVRDGLERLGDLLEGDDGLELSNFLNTPGVAVTDKLALAGRILTSLKFRQDLIDFLAVLVRRNRLHLLPRILREFEIISTDIENILAVDVHTAILLTREQLDRLSQALTKRLGKKVRLSQHLTPDLIAGARVEVAGQVIDASLQGRLEGLRRHLVQAN
ncbi:MAG: ATP synthase F1 subunit delta [Planctomycetota bacterium]|jgi:F-type H+-transporting ATPase subunit delta|nr:ATP synthase F1 subunit delta [Planctomycetota bacterium]